MTNTIIEFDSSDYCILINLVMVWWVAFSFIFHYVISFFFQKFVMSSMKTGNSKFHFVSLLHGTKFEAFTNSFIIGSFG